MESVDGWVFRRNYYALMVAIFGNMNASDALVKMDIVKEYKYEPKKRKPGARQLLGEATHILCNICGLQRKTAAALFGVSPNTISEALKLKGVYHDARAEARRRRAEDER